MGLLRKNTEYKEVIASRTAPGHLLTEKFPVLSFAPATEFDLETRDFKITGPVKNELKWGG